MFERNFLHQSVSWLKNVSFEFIPINENEVPKLLISIFDDEKEFHIFNNKYNNTANPEEARKVELMLDKYLKRKLILDYGNAMIKIQSL